MKRARVWVLLVGLLGGTQCLYAEETAPETLPMTTTNTLNAGVTELWGMMCDAGMIDDEQYQFVIENGHLPINTTVKDSPIPEEEQGDLMNLEQHKVITPDELVSILYNGSMPDMTDSEYQAFVDLAPVYEPDKSKRLTYELRRKHIDVELIRLAHRLHDKYSSLHSEAEIRASELGIPMRIDSPDGTAELQYFNKRGDPIYYVTCGALACDTISTDEVWPTNALSQANTNGFLIGSNMVYLTGTNVTLCMWDTASPRYTHEAFVGHFQYPHGTSFNFNDPSSHATDVAGIMAAGGANFEAHGAAYASTVNAYLWEMDFAILAYVSTGGASQVSCHTYAGAYGWFNGDWKGDPEIDPEEDYKFGYYSDIQRQLDEIVDTAKYFLPIWAVGNDRDDEAEGYYYPADGYADGGYDTISRGIAKNVIGVGAVETLSGGYNGTTSVVMTAYSGFGPTDDGRIKPDIVASGKGGIVPSTVNDHWYHLQELPGTSYATPAIAGSIGLLQELQTRLHGTNAPLWASTYKGIVLHTADEAGDTPGPDYRFGWGLMNTLSAAELIYDDAQWNSKPFIKEVTLHNGDEVNFAVMADTNQPLRVTICWTDPPGIPAEISADPTNIMLVHDIDLRIIDSIGSTNYPWVLDPTDYTLSATNGDNIVDNIEQIVVDATTTGLYSIVVSHKGTIVSNDCSQDVSIILSGNIPEEVAPTEVNISIETNGTPRLEWNSVVGSLHTIMSSTNLVDSNSWVVIPEATLSILQEQSEWIDASNSFNNVQFYRIQENK